MGVVENLYLLEKKEFGMKNTTWTEERLKETHNMLVDTAKRISSIVTTYQKYFGENTK